MTAGRIRAKIWLVVVGVFALGCVTGAALDGVYRMQASNEPEEARGSRDKEEIFNSLQRDLKLTAQQAADIRTIIDQTRDEYRSLRLEVRPRYDAVRQSARSRIRTLLTPEQQELFDITVAQKDAARKSKPDR